MHYPPTQTCRGSVTEQSSNRTKRTLVRGPYREKPAILREQGGDALTEHTRQEPPQTLIFRRPFSHTIQERRRLAQKHGGGSLSTPLDGQLLVAIGDLGRFTQTHAHYRNTTGICAQRCLTDASRHPFRHPFWQSPGLETGGPNMEAPGKTQFSDPDFQRVGYRAKLYPDKENPGPTTLPGKKRVSLQRRVFLLPKPRDTLFFS